MQAVEILKAKPQKYVEQFFVFAIALGVPCELLSMYLQSQNQETLADIFNYLTIAVSSLGLQTFLVEFLILIKA